MTLQSLGLWTAFMLCNSGYGYGYGYGSGGGYGGGYGDGSGNGYGDGDGDGGGYGGGDGDGYGIGDGSGGGGGGGRGDPHPTNKLSAMTVPEDPLCTRLLSDKYPDINFYICQLQLMRGKHNE